MCLGSDSVRVEGSNENGNLELPREKGGGKEEGEGRDKENEGEEGTGFRRLPVRLDPGPPFHLQ